MSSTDLPNKSNGHQHQPHPARQRGLQPRQMQRNMSRPMGRKMGNGTYAMGPEDPFMADLQARANEQYEKRATMQLKEDPKPTLNIENSKPFSIRLPEESRLSEVVEMPAERVIPSLTESVGVGGKNNLEDINIVNYHLMEAGLITQLDELPAEAEEPISEDKIPHLIAALFTFQKEVLHWKKADGNIGGPESATLAALKSTTPEEVAAKREAYPAIKAKREAEIAAAAKEEADRLAKIEAEEKAKAKAEAAEQARIDKLKNEPATAENAKKLIAEHSDMLALASRMKAYVGLNPKLVKAVLNQLGRTERDNLSFALLNRLSDSMLASTDHALLSDMKASLEAWFVASPTTDYEQAIARIDWVLGKRRKVEKKNKEVQVIKEGITTPEKAPYASQTDNSYDTSKVYGEGASNKQVYSYNTCNITSLAMALRALAPEKEIRATVLAQLKEGGFTGEEIESKKDYDIEDLMLYRFQQLGIAYWEEVMKKETGQDFSFKGKQFLPHQYAHCLTKMGQLVINNLEGSVSTVDTSKQDTDIKSHYMKRISPKLKVGEKLILSTKLTAGHIVYLQEVKEDGLIVQDPYGLNTGEKGSYLVNGSNNLTGSKMNKRLAALSNTTLSNRLKYNKSLKEKVEEVKKTSSIKLPKNLGELNFYNWNEVKKFNIGKWLITLKKTTE